MTEEARHWIRGVNLGGFLLLERFITPYLFAISSCDLTGDFRTFPNQIDSPPLPPHADTKTLFKNDTSICKPVLPYPVDEWTLSSSFPSKALARAYLERHWENFVTYEDLQAIKNSGLSHIRIPVPHWMLEGDAIPETEAWVDGQWPHFVRVCHWAREIGLEVWPDIHTAPGSQNGFDNSGRLLPVPTGKGWSEDKGNVERSLNAVKVLARAIVKEGIDDVVTGMGVLNEPFLDIDIDTMKRFNEDAFTIVREEMGDEVGVYIGDLFNATQWNGFWDDGEEFHDTYLDSHYYHVFGEKTRALSPKQHIAFLCHMNSRDTNSCCYDQSSDNKSNNKTPSKGMSHIVGEWSASYDRLTVDKLTDVMDEISKTGKALEFDRQLSAERKEFLGNFVKAQMVTWESVDTGVSSGWFFWTFKTEGGAFAEWDYLRGVREGWIPTSIPEDTSEQQFGTCMDILHQTKDDKSIVHEFPDPSTLPVNDWELPIDDDLVLHPEHDGVGGFFSGKKKKSVRVSETVDSATGDTKQHKNRHLFLFAVLVLGAVAGIKYRKSTQHAMYAEVGRV